MEEGIIKSRLQKGGGVHGLFFQVQFNRYSEM
jgi:hypothetical protein